jgi:hypothetical protein
MPTPATMSAETIPETRSEGYISKINNENRRFEGNRYTQGTTVD